MLTKISVIFKLVLTTIAVGLAAPLSAAVVINEIAWMGTPSSATDEWIELANTKDSPVDLSGWILRIEEKKDIALSGTLQSNGFYLIERTDDTAVPNVPADLVSSFGQGGLANTGETLVLLDAAGVIVETLQGGENWGTLGGDNSTKETAQRKGSVWVTAPPTPKSSNGTVSAASFQTEAASSSPETSGEQSEEVQSSSHFSPPSRINVTITGPTRVVVGADATFRGAAYGLKDALIPNARLVWNFGDGGIGEGKSVLHVYRHPGKYIVVLDASSGEHAGSNRLTVEAVPPDIAISEISSGPTGFIKVFNNSPYELDLSHWHLKSGEKTFAIPSNTFVGGKSGIIFANELTTLILLENGTALLYPNGMEAARFKEEKAAVAEPQPLQPIPERKTAAKKVVTVLELQEEDDHIEKEDTATSSAVAAVGLAEEGDTSSWILGVLILGILGCASIILSKKSREEKTEPRGGTADLNVADFALEEEKRN